MFGPRADMGAAPCEVQERLSKGVGDVGDRHDGEDRCRRHPVLSPNRSCAYEGWTVAELKKRAKLGISGYSGLSKEKLIALIRSY